MGSDYASRNTTLAIQCAKREGRSENWIKVKNPHVQ